VAESPLYKAYLFGSRCKIMGSSDPEVNCTGLRGHMSLRPIAPNPATVIAQLQLILPASRNMNTHGPNSEPKFTLRSVAESYRSLSDCAAGLVRAAC